MGLWVVIFVDLGLWVMIPMSGFSSWRSGFVDLWQVGGFEIGRASCRERVSPYV